MGIVNNISISSFDNTFTSQSVPASSTVIKDTINGIGYVNVSVKGNGNKFINVVATIDGGADIVISPSNKAVTVDYAFQTSFILKLINTDTSAHPSSDISDSGVTQ